MAALFSRRILAAIAAGVLLIAAAVAWAGDWKIETRVFERDARQASAATTTYFQDGVYYDVRGEGDELMTFDPKTGRIALADRNRRLRTEIKTDDLARLAERFRAAARKHGDAAIRFAASGKFAASFDERSRELTVAGAPLTYRAACERPGDASDAERCREFSDWCARLNSVHRGGLPARARLALNEELARREMVPTTVRLTLRDERSAKETPLRSEHAYTWRLSTDDLVRIARAKKLAAECKPVSFAEYLGYEATPRDNAAANH